MSLLVVLALAVGLDEHVGDRVPRDLAFHDPAGQTLTSGALFDGHRPVVLVLAYAKCKMLCSVVLRGVIEATRADPPGREYVAAVVSLDPRDPGRAMPAGWQYLVGDDRSIHALAGALGFRYTWDPHTEQYAHPAVVFVLTPDGRIAEDLRGVEYPTLHDALARAREGTLTPSAARDLLTCFHFDPSLRRYDRQLRLLFSLGAGVVLVSLATMIVWVSRLRRRA